jgi:hypothetical protein
VTPTPVVQPKVCTAQDLAQAQSACNGGPTTQGCQNFLKTLLSNGAAKCEACLAPFVVPFAQGSGIFECLAPFVPASCNQDSACYVDCETTVCAKCAAAQLTQCQATARTGTCSSYTQGLTCLATGLSGAGAFCNPGSYSGFGAWLNGVGSHYCL